MSQNNLNSSINNDGEGQEEMLSHGLVLAPCFWDCICAFLHIKCSLNGKLSTRRYRSVFLYHVHTLMLIKKP